MPRYAYQKPVNRLYAYNYKYMNNYYKPLSQYIETKSEVLPERTKRAPSEQPGHQSLAERLKTYPMDGSIYRPRASSAPPTRRFYIIDDDEDFFPKPSKASKEAEDDFFTAPFAGRRAPGKPTRPLSTYEPSAMAKLWRLDPIWFRHPWDWDCVWVPPHENRSRPHFGVGTNHDLILKFLAKRPRRYYYLDDLFLDF
ncbi:uncharacterized protein LOC127000256 isoform X2 [Eriocheir sinensis]|uniref:uncharacterized protein LOC127000256 isoform X2 n=1 Tax=Eriocheir sinensis TaxID=95602 RepID=UPI0021C8A55D|nr:uncharacterized protein LOC127000256 isoform X2 [Eriocheir sinensis]